MKDATRLSSLREIGDFPLAARILRILATSRESVALSNDSESRAARRRSRLEPCEAVSPPRIRGAERRAFEAVKPPRTARSHGSRRLRRLAARDSLSFERAELSRDVARIRRILAACRTWSGNVVRTRRVLTASGKFSISRNDERRLRRLSNHAPRSRCSLWCPRAALPRQRAEGACGSLSAYITGRASLSRARGAQRRERRGSPSGRPVPPAAV